MRALRDAWVVAAFDLGESLRSKRAIAFLVLFVGGAIAGAVLFTEVLRTIETELAEQLLVARTERPGSLTQAVMEADETRRLLARLIRDRALAESLLTVPPIALFYGWFALTFGPIFVVLTSSETIAAELATGSARYSLVRTERAAWALGKLLGQGALLAVGIAGGAVAAWITGEVRLSGYGALEALGWVVRYAATAFVYAFAFLGLALGVSQLTRSVAWSRALGLLAFALVSGVSRYVADDDVRPEAPALYDSIGLFFPAAYKLDLWRPQLEDVAPALLLLVALGVSYFALGHLRLARRDA